MAHNRSFVWKHKKVSLQSKYGVEDGDYVPNPLSFKEYLRNMLKRGSGERMLCSTHSLACLI